MSSCSSPGLASSLAVDPAFRQPESISDGDIGDRSTSTTYTYYLRDGVGYSSFQRWDTLTRSGSGYWTIGTEDAGTASEKRYFHAPEAADTFTELISPQFTIPANTGGVKLTFKTRYSGLPSGKIQLSTSNGTNWTDLASFSGSNSTSYWGSASARLWLPANNSASPVNGIVRFVADTTGAAATAVWDIDSIAIYRTEVTTSPITLSVGPGARAGTALLSWTYQVRQGDVTPSSYKVYISNSPDSGFTFFNSVPFTEGNPPRGQVTVAKGSSTKYYRITGYKGGVPESIPSNVVSVGP
jgi:hypothetical protein